MMGRTSTVALTLILTCSSCAGETATTHPVGKPHTTTASAPAADKGVMKILKDLEAAGEKYATIRGDVTMETIDRLAGDSEVSTGWIAYQKASAKSPAMFRVHFDTLKQGAGATFKRKLDYAFDGEWMTVRKPRIKEMTRFQVEKLEPMRLGKGPFPLPFGQKTEDVLERFNVSTRAVGPKEPPSTRYLKFVPRRKYYKEINFKSVEMWVHPKTYLPVKLINQDKRKKTTKVSFKNVQTNMKLDQEKMFHIPDPPRIWTYTVKRLGE